ncbi:hypothetical protein CBF34_10200 [Vagococcus penaei]|uniref:Foldase protein PrsA n=1 Tax=Vagococcus penaei TaxID=633807 RepID=A0A1Q2D6V9_9ENTE|nr:peptidylprolyl isomerase [Vagococcus penaei]AQP54087.1 hypothetical protein BW732_07555 [Vagococcus penaei]RST98495.1 hypothetical protein CBF34_10200 [Vagococcus penaei]
MKKTSIKLVAATALGLITLAGCSGGGKDIVTMKGGKITQDEFYTQLTKDEQSKQVLTGMIFNKIALENYGKDVSKEAIDKEYSAAEKQYGGQKVFEETLKQYNLDTKQFKENIKSNLAQKAMMEAHVKITDADLEEAWKTYHPDVEAQIIMVDKQDTADSILKDVKDNGDFAKIAKEKSQDTTTKEDGGKVTFNSTATTKPENVMIPQNVKEAAYKLEDGQVSDVIKAQNQMTGAESYYIVKMDKNQKKGNDYKPFEKQLKEVVKQNKLADPAFQQKVLGDELNKANVKIKDNQFKDILTPYLPKKEDTKQSDASKDSQATESSKEASTDSSK